MDNKEFERKKKNNENRQTKVINMGKHTQLMGVIALIID